MNLSAIECSSPPKAQVALTLEDESIRVLLLQIAKALVPGEDVVSVSISTEGEFSTATVMIAPELLGRLSESKGASPDQFARS